MSGPQFLLYSENKLFIMPARKINMGMVGGGPGSFIGRIHVNSALIDGQINFVCGAFSSDPEKSKITGREYYLDPSRAYGSFQEMIQREKELPEGERMDFLSVTTPNHVHFAPAKLALENGFHVVSDKPLTSDTGDAKELVRLVEETGLIFAVTHAYTGYPIVKEAKEISDRSGGGLTILGSRNNIVDGGEGMPCHETLGFPLLDLREEFGGRVHPGVSNQENVQEHIDIEENLHVPYLSRRYWR